jgi:hypothetical protein
MELTKEEIKALAEYVYYGMSLKEAFVLIGKGTKDILSVVLADRALMRVLTYAKTKAKLEHMQAAQRLALAQNPTIVSLGALKHMLAARFGFSESNKELALKKAQHEDIMNHKREALKQWADYQTAKMIQTASGQQLIEYQELDSSHRT